MDPFNKNKAIQTKFKLFVNFDEQSRVLSGHCVCCGEWHNLLFGLVIAQDSWSSSSFSILFLYNYLHVNLFYFVHGLIKVFTEYYFVEQMINELVILILVCNIPQKKVGGLVWTSEISQPTTTVTSVWVTLRRTRNQTNRRS